MANPAVGYITREALCAALPERIEIRKSGKKSPRYALYLGTPFGPWQMNTPGAQDVLLEHGAIYGAGGAPGQKAVPEPCAPVPAMPAPDPEPEPNTRIRELPALSRVLEPHSRELTAEENAEPTPQGEPEKPARRGWFDDLEEPF